jgi:hypothetical protein
LEARSSARQWRLEPIEVAMRWIAYHSALKDDDGIIIGASKTEQVIATTNLIKRGPLPDVILPAIPSATTLLHSKTLFLP